MAIRRLQAESTLEEVIQKGASVKADREKKKKEWTNFTLRIQKNMSENIDKYLESKAGISKTGFMLQAIQEKLEREKI